MALLSLRTNKMRSFLTLLGVIIGVGAVIAMLSLGLGAKREVSRSIQGLGANLVTVVPGQIELDSLIGQSPSEMKGVMGMMANRLRPEMAEKLQEELPPDYQVAPVFIDTKEVTYGERTHFTQLVGSNQNYPRVMDFSVARGEAFGRKDMFRDVAVIGQEVAQALFGELDPLGKQMRIGGRRFTVVGVTEPKGSTFFVDNDDVVWIPYTRMARYFGKSLPDTILIASPDEGGVPLAVETAERFMLEQGLDKTEFTAITQKNLMGFADSILRILTYTLGAIAGISLLVGGIGIMNIMLVSVTERTREIGVRKAVGAKTRDILLQFLLESMCISTIGGVVGIILAIAGATALGEALNIPAHITVWVICLAFFFSAGVGVFFGVYPARKASRMDPIAALRYE